VLGSILAQLGVAMGMNETDVQTMLATLGDKFSYVANH
jgi:hypothetical protein